MTATTDPAARRREEVERNFHAFQELLPTIAAKQAGKFALMRDGKIVEFFDTAHDAALAGQKLYPDDQLFSVQEVTATPVNLGFLSYAGSER
jgi:hypothetical protein